MIKKSTDNLSTNAVQTNHKDNRGHEQACQKGPNRRHEQTDKTVDQVQMSSRDALRVFAIDERDSFWLSMVAKEAAGACFHCILINHWCHPAYYLTWLGIHGHISKWAETGGVILLPKYSHMKTCTVVPSKSCYFKTIVWIFFLFFNNWHCTTGLGSLYLKKIKALPSNYRLVSLKGL